jgi:hypothetical protein
MRGRDHAGSLETVIPLRFMPIGPRQQPQNHKAATEAGRTTMLARKSAATCVRRFSWEAVDESGQITFIRAR